ncbi:four helix bundle protein [Candidatus Cerribacteria bacterium 'Amazon FNV 2010 28 9']|uniref:Four helix bundle protein n=1 Tax=Candidatus Cerribacteria bacterium 'Amazon FNV 2010 28 9' TaxID=2081795 RepID=A0A317JQD6_9BACT|nr:MAG: four helix bundle protein [Candidatus Cerribacteria bacterium 'Amazon FNV 2010 28 9']
MKGKCYDLEKRTTLFAEKVIDFLRTLKQDAINRRLIEQCCGSAGSIGANYYEANEAESKKDFLHKIKIAIKEIKETKHWLQLLAKANPSQVETCRELWQEAHQLLLIFSKIVVSIKKKDKEFENL